MAKDNELMNIALIAGGGFAVYWYITNYGPNGAASAGNVSWWQTWFGTSTAAQVATGTGTGTSTTPAASINTSATGTTAGTGNGLPAGTTPKQTSTPAPSLSSQLQAAATAAGYANIVSSGNPANTPGQLNADEWNYFYEQVTGNTAGVNPTTFNAAFFPNGRPASPADVVQNQINSYTQMQVANQQLGINVDFALPNASVLLTQAQALPQSYNYPVYTAQAWVAALAATGDATFKGMAGIINLPSFGGGGGMGMKGFGGAFSSKPRAKSGAMAGMIYGASGRVN